MRSLFPPACYMPDASQLASFYQPKNILCSVNLLSSSLCRLLQPPATSSLLDSNIILCTVFSNAL
jgi:hypothetical protein